MSQSLSVNRASSTTERNDSALCDEKGIVGNPNGYQTCCILLIQEIIHVSNIRVVTAYLVG